ncbi:MAG TPA: hypothetical protein VMU39_20710 [Solirubrobacteraceae bacterium]|nr:hypothetical protein [Solirubrobacteraceae bacterium]
MSVLVRSKRGESSVRRRRLRQAGRTEERAPTTLAGAPGARAVAPTTTTTAPGRRRELGPVQDQALYTCQCGFVFKAPVSTSVDCPHCGDSQAW